MSAEDRGRFPASAPFLDSPGRLLYNEGAVTTAEKEDGNTMNKERLKEIIRFAVAGGAGFVLEFALLILMKEKMGMDTLLAAGIAFVISVIVNYIVCVLWVFRGAKNQKKSGQLFFFLTSAAGLAINEGLMLLFRVTWGEETVLATVFGHDVKLYLVNKVIASAAVMVWNYITKKKILTRG